LKAGFAAEQIQHKLNMHNGPFLWARVLLVATAALLSSAASNPKAKKQCFGLCPGEIRKADLPKYTHDPARKNPPSQSEYENLKWRTQNAETKVSVHMLPTPIGVATSSELVQCFMDHHEGIDPRLDPTTGSAMQAIRAATYQGYIPEDLAGYWGDQQVTNYAGRTENADSATLVIFNPNIVISYFAKFCKGIGHEQRMNKWAVSIVDSPRYQRHNGTDHVFICGSWMCGGHLRAQLFMLNPLVEGMIITALETPDFGTGNSEFAASHNPWQPLIVIPYVAHSGIDLGPPSTTPDHQQGLQTPPAPPRPRTHRLTFLGEVHRKRQGGALRKKLINVTGITLHQECQTDVLHIHNGVAYENVKSGRAKPKLLDANNNEKCKNQSDSSYGEYSGIMMSSEMCLIVEGDSLSTRRLFDAILAGCIPVFVGRKYTRPFERLVPYDSFSWRIEVEPYLANPQIAIDTFLAGITPSKLESRREEMAKYAGLLNWRIGSGVLLGIIAQIGDTHPGIYLPVGDHRSVVRGTESKKKHINRGNFLANPGGKKYHANH